MYMYVCILIVAHPFFTYPLSDRGRSIVRMSTGGRAPRMQMFGARMQMCRGGGNYQLEESIAQLLVDAGECLLVAYVLVD